MKTSDLCDASDEIQACSLALLNYGHRHAFAGTIQTVQCFETVDLIVSALNQPGHDQVLVIDGGGSIQKALFGDRLADIALKNGWCGLVIHGAIRDSREINAMDIGVKALGTAPRRGHKSRDGQTGIPVSFGGITFTPGCRLVADNDGVVVLPPHLKETDIRTEDALSQTASYLHSAKGQASARHSTD